MRYIASISYGKDSLAQLEVIYLHGLPLTDIVTADISEQMKHLRAYSIEN